MRNNLSSLLAGLTLVVCASTQAYSLPGSVARCRTLADDSQRLACYDQAVEALANTPAAPSKSALQPAVAAKSAAKPQPPVAAKPVQPSTDASFGKEHLKKAAKPVESQQPERLESQVTKVSKDAYKKSLVSLANGQVWKMADKQLKVKAGDTIYIKRGMLSAYYLGKPGVNKTVRVKRLK